MSLKSDGLRILSKSRIKICKCHFQYIDKVFNVKFWPNYDMAVANSPHVRFLKKYKEVGMDFDKLWKTDYVNLMLYWNSIKFYNRDNKFIKNKIRRFVNLYKNIEKKGFQSESRIQVLKTPFWITRYNGKEDFLKGYEIWHGHHRASCCHVLGINKIPCVILEDKKPGRMKCLRIDRKLAKVKQK